MTARATEHPTPLAMQTAWAAIDDAHAKARAALADCALEGVSSVDRGIVATTMPGFNTTIRLAGKD